MLPSSLGRYAVGLGLDGNSALGLGETIYLRASGFPNGGRETSILDPTPRNRALAGGVILPIGTDGLTLNMEGVDARTAPRHRGFPHGTDSRFNRAEEQRGGAEGGNSMRCRGGPDHQKKKTK